MLIYLSSPCIHSAHSIRSLPSFNEPLHTACLTTRCEPTSIYAYLSLISLYPSPYSIRSQPSYNEPLHTACLTRAVTNCTLLYHIQSEYVLSDDQMRAYFLPDVTWRMRTAMGQVEMMCAPGEFKPRLTKIYPYPILSKQKAIEQAEMMCAPGVPLYSCPP